jgi:hypothetical protein
LKKKDKEMLTLEKFQLLPPGKVFAKGEIEDSQEGLNMTGGEGMLKWVAKKGWANDWCVYTHYAHFYWEYIESNGDKVCGKENIQKVVPCTEEVFELYRC